MDDVTKDPSMSARWRSSPLAAGDALYLEGLYEAYLRDPASVDATWRRYFEELPRVSGAQEVSHADIREEFRRRAYQTRPAAAPSAQALADAVEPARKQVKVLQLINAFRFRAHQNARLEPLGIRELPGVPELDLRHHGLTEADLDTVF